MYQFDEKYLDILRELVNIGVGNGGSILNTLINSHIELQVPEVTVLEYEEMEKRIEAFGPMKHDVIYLPFHGHISGSAQIILTIKSADSLANLLSRINNEKSPTKVYITDTLKEVGNIIINSVLGTISNNIYFHFNYSAPIFYEGNVEKLLLRRGKDFKSKYLLAQTVFSVDHLNISGTIIILFKEDAFEELLHALNVYLVDNGIEVA